MASNAFRYSASPAPGSLSSLAASRSAGSSYSTTRHVLGAASLTSTSGATASKIGSGAGFSTSATRSTSIHPSSLLSAWSPPTHVSSSSTSASSVATTPFTPSSPALTSISRMTPQSPLLPNLHMLSMNGSPTPSASHKADSARSSPPAASSSALSSAYVGSPNFVGPIAPCPSPVVAAPLMGGMPIMTSPKTSSLSSPQNPLRPVLSSMSGSTSPRARGLRRYSPIRSMSTSSAASASASSLQSSSLFAQLAELHNNNSNAGNSTVSGRRRLSSSSQQARPSNNNEEPRKPSAADDPYPLPFSPELDPKSAAQASSEAQTTEQSPAGPRIQDFDADQHRGPSAIDLATEHQNEGLDMTHTPMRVPGREDEDRETKIARLIYQTRKRGTLETDLILSTFAKKELQNMPTEEVDEFDRLLDEPDWDIFYWCAQRKQPPQRWKESFETPGKLGHRLRIHTKNEEKVVRFMPRLEVGDRK